MGLLKYNGSKEQCGESGIHPQTILIYHRFNIKSRGRSKKIINIHSVPLEKADTCGKRGKYSGIGNF